MPTNDVDNLPEFTQCLGKTSAIIEENDDVNFVYMLGDYNADPSEVFYRNLVNFCRDEHWTCADLGFLGESDTYTFVSEVWGSVSWLDHCVVTNAALPTITRVWVEHSVQWSDHFPLFVECNLGQILCTVTIPIRPVLNKCYWGERNADQITRYHEICHERLREVDFPVELSQCCDGVCSNMEHISIVRNMYLRVVTILSEAATSTCVGGRARRRGGYIAGWNKYVTQFHKEARQKFLVWVDAGKPSSGQTYVAMCESRKIFKRQLKWCQDRQEQITMDILASHHYGNDFRKFWKQTGKLNGGYGLPVSVGGISDHEKIADLFGRQFETRLQHPEAMCGMVDAGAVTQERTIRFTAKQVRKVIGGMRRGKSPGHDGLSIEHFKYAGVHLPRVLAMFYNLCVCHGYLPSDLTRTVVIPIAKNRRGDLSDVGNYRPISLATVTAKVLDGLLNDILQNYIKLHDAQFGFRAGLSTDTAIVCLKQAVRYYTDRKTSVYACFLDLSKAFDTVIYDKLWGKLKGAGAPKEVIRIFKYWYDNQRNQVRWAGKLSGEYSMKCGVRQGGLTSPLLFNLYINDLIVELSSTHTGCIIDNVCVNNISYADDMVLLGPTVGAIRKLTAICEAYAVEHGLRYNSKKSEVLVFKSKTSAPAHVPPIKINGETLRVVTSFKYLGHVVTEKLRDDADLERERRSLAVRGNMLARRFTRCSREVKITLFMAYCQSFYSGGLWLSHTRRAADALRVLYNNIFRMLLRLPPDCSASRMFAEAHVDGFHAIMRKKVASIRGRVRGSGNSILKMIATRLDCPIQERWMRILVD